MLIDDRLRKKKSQMRSREETHAKKELDGMNK
jgi:hypothetical protein